MTKKRGTIDMMHEDFLRKALDKTNGDRVLTAKLLGITERTVHRKMSLYGIVYRKKKGLD